MSQLFSFKIRAFCLGSDGSAVASNTRGLRFESIRRQNLNSYSVNCIEKTKINKKAGGSVPIINEIKSSLL